MIYVTFTGKLQNTAHSSATHVQPTPNTMRSELAPYTSLPPLTCGSWFCVRLRFWAITQALLVDEREAGFSAPCDSLALCAQRDAGRTRQLPTWPSWHLLKVQTPRAAHALATRTVHTHTHTHTRSLLAGHVNWGESLHRRLHETLRLDSQPAQAGGTFQGSQWRTVCASLTH